MPDLPSRRRLFQTGAVAFTAASYSRILGANDSVQLGVIGCGGRGQYVMQKFLHNPEVRIVAVCDVWGDRTEEAAEKARNADVKKFGDHRQLLSEVQTDAILIATPDHWHVPIAMDAVDAGKDVYCEKPLTLKIEEGPAIVKAAREKKRVFQVGMQQRSGSTFLQARDEYFRTKKLGKVTFVRTYWHGNSVHLIRAPESLKTKPANLDWDRFLGPAKWRAWDPQQYWCFRAYLDFGGGQITDLFTHWIDTAHMLLGEDNPISAVAGGGIYHYKDGRTAPDTINVVLEYPGQWNATFDATLVPGAIGASIEIYGTDGRMQIDRKGFTFVPAEKGAQPVVVKATVEQTEEHVRNFLDCLRSRQEPNGDVYVGHRSAQASHLGNIAWEQKRRIMFNPEREEILPL
jgi:predicted dehydrogenase